MTPVRVAGAAGNRNMVAGFKIVNFLSFDTIFNQSLNILQLFCFVSAYQRDGFACGSGARCPSNTMHVILRHIRQVKINDEW